MERDLQACAVAAAQAGGRYLAETFRARPLEIQSKGQHDFVTDADRGSERLVLEEIGRRFPDHGILSEERGLVGVEASDYRWIVDPLDGTTNFLQGLPVYAVSVACMRGDELVAAAVFDPEGDNLFAAARGKGATWNGAPMRVAERSGLEGAFLATGYPFRARRALELYMSVFREIFLQARAIRRCGAAALDLAYTAAGVYDGFFEFRLSSWDIAAGALLIEEAGGRVSDLDGTGRYLESGNVLAGAPGVHQDLCAAVAEHVDEATVDAADPQVTDGAVTAC